MSKINARVFPFWESQDALLLQILERLGVVILLGKGFDFPVGGLNIIVWFCLDARFGHPVTKVSRIASSSEISERALDRFRCWYEHCSGLLVFCMSANRNPFVFKGSCHAILICLSGDNVLHLRNRHRDLRYWTRYQSQTFAVTDDWHIH